MMRSRYEQNFADQFNEVDELLKNFDDALAGAELFADQIKRKIDYADKCIEVLRQALANRKRFEQRPESDFAELEFQLAKQDALLQKHLTSCRKRKAREGGQGSLD